jgi:hypothetical protein
MRHTPTIPSTAPDPGAEPSSERPAARAPCPVKGPAEGESVSDWLVRDAAEREARQLEGLAELAAMGLSLARAVHRRAEAVQAGADDGAETAAALAGLGTAYTRLARAVRDTWGLETRIAEARRQRAMGLEVARVDALAAEETRRATEQVSRNIAAINIQSIVDDLIDAEHEGDDDAWDRLHDLAEEQILAIQDDEDFRDRPTGEVVAAVAKAIGLNPDWDRFAEEDWAEEDREARAWGSPYGRGFKPWGPSDITGPAREGTGPP